MRGGVTCNCTDEIWNLNVPFRPNNRMCAFSLRGKSKLNLFTLYLSDYEQRFLIKIDDIGWPKHDQSLFESWFDHRKGDILQWRGEGSLLTNILCRNCADKNETVVRKILEVRESFESSRVHWKAGQGPQKVHVLAKKLADNKRALFVES